MLVAVAITVFGALLLLWAATDKDCQYCWHRDLNYIMPAVLGLWAFAGLAAMTKWAHHDSEIMDKTMEHENDVMGTHRDECE